MRGGFSETLDIKTKIASELLDNNKEVQIDIMYLDAFFRKKCKEFIEYQCETFVQSCNVALKLYSENKLDPEIIKNLGGIGRCWHFYGFLTLLFGFPLGVFVLQKMGFLEIKFKASIKF